MSNSRTTILSKSQTHTLSAQPRNGRLYLCLQIFQKDKNTGCRQLTKKYTKFLTLGHYSQIRSRFKSIGAMIDHLRNQENYGVDQMEGVLTVFQNRRKVVEISLEEKEVPGVGREEDSDVFRRRINKPTANSYYFHAEDDEDVGQEKRRASRKDSDDFSASYSIQMDRGKPKNQIQIPKYPQISHKILPINMYNPYQALKKTQLPQTNLSPKLAYLQTRISILQQQNSLKDEVISKLLNRINNQDINSNELSNKLSVQIRNLNQKITGIQKYLRIQGKSKQKEKEKQRERDREGKKEGKQEVEEESGVDEVEEEEEEKEALVHLRDWIDAECYASKYIRIKDNYLYAYGGSRLAIFSKQKIKSKHHLTLCPKTQTQPIGLGLADTSYKTSPQFLQKQHTILYKTNGDFYYKGKHQHRPIHHDLNKGRKFQMVVDWEFGRVEWRVGGDVVLRVDDVKGEMRGIGWVGVVWVEGRGDCVEFFG